MLAVELGQRGADPRAARPVRDAVGGARERAVGIAARQLARDARQPGAEHERLDAGARGDARLQVLQQHPRVRRHRAGDVAHEHQPPRPHRRLAVAPLDQLAAVAQRHAHGRAQVVQLAPPACRPRAPRQPPRRPAREPREQLARERALVVGVLGEVLLAQQLLLAPGGRDRDLLDRGRLRPRSGCRRAAAPTARSGRAARTGRGTSSRREDGRERLGEARVVRPRRAQRGAQREVGVVGEAASTAASARCAASSSPDADRGAAGAHVRRELRQPVGHRTPRARAQTPPSTPRSRTRSMSSRTFSATPSVPSRSPVAVERQQRARPRDRLPHAGQLVQLLLAQPRDRARRRARRSPPARRAAACGRSRPRARASGSRSSGTGSGA